MQPKLGCSAAGASFMTGNRQRNPFWDEHFEGRESDENSDGQRQVAAKKINSAARGLCDLLARHDWDSRKVADVRKQEPASLYREWLASLGWNQSLAARIVARNYKLRFRSVR